MKQALFLFFYFLFFARSEVTYLLYTRVLRHRTRHATANDSLRAH